METSRFDKSVTILEKTTDLELLNPHTGYNDKFLQKLPESRLQSIILPREFLCYFSSLRHLKKQKTKKERYAKSNSILKDNAQN